LPDRHSHQELTTVIICPTSSPQNARIAAEKQQQAREAQQALRLEEADSLGKVDSKEDSSIGEKKVKVVPVLV
jgi:hypothetical protein